MTQQEFMIEFGVKEEIQEFPGNQGNLLNMPFKTYIMMSEKKAIQTHIQNLINTYGLDIVVENTIEVVRRNE